MSLIIEPIQPKPGVLRLSSAIIDLQLVLPSAFAVVALEDPNLYGNAEDWEKKFNKHRKALSDTAHVHCTLQGTLRSAMNELSGGANYHGVLNAARIAKRLHVQVLALSNALTKINHVPGALAHFADFRKFCTTFSAWDSLIAWAACPFTEQTYQAAQYALKRKYPNHHVWDPIYVHLSEIKAEYAK